MYPMGLSDAHFYSKRIALLATSGYRPCLCREIVQSSKTF